jgi:virginiamycin B lyase
MTGAAAVVASLGAPAALTRETAPAGSGVSPHVMGSVDLREWEVPWPDTRPRDPYAVSESEVWFVGQRGDYVGKLDPLTGEFERIDLDEGAGPHNLIVSQDGAIWYAGNRAAHIGRIDPETGDIEKIAMPEAAARDPHTLVFDAAGDIWFTVQGGNFIGKLTRLSRKVQLIGVPTPQARPYGIEIAGNGTVWSVLLGTNKIASVDPGTMTLTEYALPRAEARPRRIGITDDGRIWYVDYAGGMLGSYDPDTGKFAEWAMPSGAQSRPYGMAVDARNRIWIVETGVEPNRFIGFDPSTRRFFAASDVPSGGGTVRHMHYHEPTNTIWFGADTNTIGRAALD